MNDEQIEIAASILEDLVGTHFHDAICEGMGENLLLTEDWFPSDEEIYRIKDELIILLKQR
jgi:hypothetical protein